MHANGVLTNTEVAKTLTRVQRQRQKRKEKAKEKKKLGLEAPASTSANQTDMEVDRNVQIDTTYNPLEEYEKEDPLFKEFSQVFAKFADASARDRENTLQTYDLQMEVEKKKRDEAYNSSIPTKESKKLKPLSKRKLRMMNRMEVAHLKTQVKRPEVVEVHDVASSDPFLLIHLKCIKNSIPVPRHWNQKRKYLQGKRGIEKPAFELPTYIQNTGIAQARAAVTEKDADKTHKQKQRERLQPKMDRVSIDYLILHDAFFKHQTKPTMTTFGELYYEGKEFEVKLKSKIPGILSAELKAALGMTDNSPPPWLLAMQKYGPPPAYPRLRVPGVNSPIPANAHYGHFAGGWGFPPLDMYKRPIFGWFEEQPPPPDDGIDKKTMWGTIIRADEPEEEEEDESSSEEVEAKDEMETDEPVEPAAAPVEKNAPKDAPTQPSQPRELFEVLAEQKGPKMGTLITTNTTYQLPKKGITVDISLESEDLELTESELKQKYEKVVQDKHREKIQPQQKISDAEYKEIMGEKAKEKKKKFKF